MELANDARPLWLPQSIGSNFLQTNALGCLYRATFLRSSPAHSIGVLFHFFCLSGCIHSTPTLVRSPVSHLHSLHLCSSSIVIIFLSLFSSRAMSVARTVNRYAFVEHTSFPLPPLSFPSLNLFGVLATTCAA